MLTQLISNPLALIYWLLAFGISLSVHEAAHAWMADHLGDPTAKLSGRLTLNPLAHIDPLGTLMLIFFRFGWGKPVPIDPYNLRNPRKDAGLISLSGPTANFLLATFLSLLFRLLSSSSWLTYFFIPLIELNLIWGVFNLLPIHPLDGGKVVVGLLPQDLAEGVERFLTENGTLLLLILIFPFFGTSPVFLIIRPIINFLSKLLLPKMPFI